MPKRSISFTPSKSDVVRDVDDELAAHLELAIEELVAAGRTPEQARAEAERRFGRRDALRVDCAKIDLHRIGSRRRADLARQVLADLRYGARGLLRNPGFALVAIITLALGIGANTALFTVVNSVLFAPLPYPQPERVVLVWNSNLERGVQRWGVSYHDFMDWRERCDAFASISAWVTTGANLTGLERPLKIRHTRVTPGFFDVMGTPPLLGRGFRWEENAEGADDVVVISHGLWQRAFGGDEQVLDRQIILNDRSMKVVGVMPPGFGFPSPDTQLWKPIGIQPDQAGNRNAYWVSCVARLTKGVSIAQAQGSMDALMEALAEEYPDTNRGMGGYVEPLQGAMVEQVRPVLMVLWGAVALVLLIACVNMANLLLARGTSRQRELAVRAALGATRARVMRQLLTESTLLALAGGAAGVLLAVWLLRLMLSLSGESLPRMNEIHTDGRVLAFAIGASVLTGLLFGVLPARRMSRIGSSGALRDGGRHGGGASHRRTLGLLVVAETALAIIVMTGAGLMLRSFNTLVNVDPGFDASRVLALRVEPVQHVTLGGQSEEAMEAFMRDRAVELEGIEQFYEQALQRIERLPGVLSVAAINQKPLAGNRWGASLVAEDGDRPPREERTRANMRVVTPQYFQTMRIPLQQGRALADTDDPAAPRVAVINRALADALWPGLDPIGRRFTGEDPDSSTVAWLEVVGVVGDVRAIAINFEPSAIIYTPLAQARFGFFGDWGMDIVLRTETDPMAVADAARAEINALDPDLPVADVRTMEQVLGDNVAGRRFSAALFGAFALLALALAAIGLYGTLAHTTSRRTREIGLRMALGARRAQVLWSVVRSGLALTTIGAIVGLGGALALTRMIEAQLYEVTATDPLTLVVVVFVLLGVAMLACLVPARRATRIDPMIALRCE